MRGLALKSARLWIGTAIVCLGVFLTIYSPDENEFPSTAKAMEAQDRLDRKLLQFYVDSRSLRWVLWDLGKQAGVRIRTDDSALAEESISVESPVTLHLRDIKGSTILRKALEQAERLQYEIDDDGNVHVFPTSHEKLRAISHTFDASDIVAWDPDDSDFLKLITDTVAPDSWRQNGGWAEIHDDHGLLRVTQTRENQLRVAWLLEKLRQSRSPQTIERLLAGGGDK